MILKSVLHHRHTNDKDEGQSTESCSVWRANFWNDLNEHAEEEVRIGKLCELYEKILWQEVQAGVLRRSDFVVAKLAIKSVFLEDLIDLE